MIGEKYWELTCIKRVPNPNGKSSGPAHYLFTCSCGGEHIASGTNVKVGNVKRCSKCNRNKKVNIAGQEFGELTAVKQLYSNKNGVHWLFVCSCGNEHITSSSNVRSGSVKRCAKCNRTHWKGYGEISGGFWYNIVWSSKKRNILLDITIEYIWELFERQNRLCALTRQPLEFRRGNRGNASLDRIDSSIGYLVGNVQWVHKDIQISKWDHGQERFIELCNLVAKANPRN